ncbi:hypothetical protein RFI_29079 [Reticulomyxa filosa]|uniref:Uncharacterized protein n=1 Tax=Reticulomyxa filosa TaxID=46433 RepID=X6M4B5_RETFI|nr:hypothetical protein RFI_29079 [Reticulomyxa filosa]|eukprot:ETO08312.1 hypothetical protein RFI_29079 [Reticulomyxa filosa]
MLSGEEEEEEEEEVRYRVIRSAGEQASTTVVTINARSNPVIIREDSVSQVMSYSRSSAKTALLGRSEQDRRQAIEDELTTRSCCGCCKLRKGLIILSLFLLVHGIYDMFGTIVSVCVGILATLCSLLGLAGVIKYRREYCIFFLRFLYCVLVLNALAVVYYCFWYDEMTLCINPCENDQHQDQTYCTHACDSARRITIIVEILFLVLQLCCIWRLNQFIGAIQKVG